MQSPLTLVLEQLKNVKQVGDNYTACCPAHDDSNPSLSVGTGEDGRVLLRCHTGCTVEAIVAAIGLGMKDHAGVATRMFQVLANESINIQLISTSEIKVSVVIEEKYTELAVRALHDAFVDAGAGDPVAES